MNRFEAIVLNVNHYSFAIRILTYRERGTFNKTILKPIKKNVSLITKIKLISNQRLCFTQLKRRKKNRTCHY